MDILILTLCIAAYMLVIGYLVYFGYKQTKTAKDYLVAGRNVHPVVMALSYGATFISTSAIVGFGGVAALFGMGLLWLTVLNIIFGIILAFVFFGKRTRTMGHSLDVHTFPELLGKRFNSRFAQGMGGLVIFLFMPLYSAAVLIGAARFLETTFPQISFNVAVLVYTLIICAYVMAGGLKGVMYTDALQGAIMFAGMVILVVLTYIKLGGFSGAHQALAAMADQVPDSLAAKGHQGWTHMPSFGSPLWWTLVSTIVMGVGIGVLAQPQLAVRFMTVRSSKELNRAMTIGGVFILFMTGVAFVIGALSNVYFFHSPEYGKIAIAAAGGNFDKVIPLYINETMPTWFVYVFMLTLLSAAMSTSSSHFHAMGTSVGRDLYSVFKGKTHTTDSVLITRIAVILTVLVTVMLGYKLPKNIIAIATAIFFGLCASTFLPTYIGALYWKGMTRAGAVSSMCTGFAGSLLYLLFIHKKEAAAIGLCKALTGVDTLLGYPWVVVDPILVVLPLSALVAVCVSLFTQKLPSEHIQNCFKHI